MLLKLGITFLRKRRAYFEFYDQPGKSITHNYVKNPTQMSLLQDNSARMVILAHFLMGEMVCLVHWALDKYLQTLRSVMNPAIFCLCDLEHVIPLLLFLLVFMS